MVYTTDADKPFAGADVQLFANNQQIGFGPGEEKHP